MTTKEIQSPEVIIALPVYNGALWLNQALDSLVSQDYESFKIIISDDCSEDETESICESYAKKYENIVFTRNDKNLGGGGYGNLLKILDICEAEYFVWASQDDYWDNDFLSVLVNKLEANKSLVLASGNIEIIRPDNISTLEFSGFWNPENLNQYLLIAALLLPVSYGSWLKTNLFIHGVIRTSVLKRCFVLHKGEISHDRAFILFSILQGGWGYVNKTLYHRRAEVGYALRESKQMDQIHTDERKITIPLYNAWQMILGVFSMKDIKFLVKIYTLFIILLYAICTYFRKLRDFFVSVFLKGLLPVKLFNGLRENYRRLMGRLM